MDLGIADMRFLRIPIESKLQCLDLVDRISVISGLLHDAKMDRKGEETHDVCMRI